MNAEAPKPDPSVQRVLRLLAGGAPAEIVIWDRGGSPGPDYESNQVTTLDDGSVFHAVFLKVRFDPENPPFKTDEYRKDLPRLRGLEHLVSGIFGRTYAEETDPRIGGVTKITFTIRVAAADGTQHELSKMFYQWLPSELHPLDTLFHDIMRVCEEEGSHQRLARPGGS